MDKPSEDFILPTTFIGVGVNNYYTEEGTAWLIFRFHFILNDFLRLRICQ